MINDNLDMSSEKSEIINRLKELYHLKELYYLNQVDKNLKKKKEIYNVLIDREINESEKKVRDQKEKGYVILPILLSKIYTNNNSKELISNIAQLIKNLCDTKQITKLVYSNLIKAITYKNDS